MVNLGEKAQIEKEGNVHTRTNSQEKNDLLNTVAALWLRAAVETFL